MPSSNNNAEGVEAPSDSAGLEITWMGVSRMGAGGNISKLGQQTDRSGS